MNGHTILVRCNSSFLRALRGGLLLGLLVLPAARAQVTTLHTFNLSPTDSQGIDANLVQDENGTIYGASRQGGASGNGTVFKIQPDGTGYQIIHSFAAGQNVVRLPEYSFILGADGALYGTSELGGALTYGSIFKIQRDGTGFTHLHSFASGGSSAALDGGAPRGGFVYGSDGFLYGLTTKGSGTSTNANDRNGVIYRIKADGSQYSVIYSFNGGAGFSNGKEPNRLMEGRDGNLYGSCRELGPKGGGFVFRIKKDGSDFTILHSFLSPGSAALAATFPYEGIAPDSELVHAGDGFIYGSTRGGGSRQRGCIYRMLPDGSAFEVVFSFGVGPNQLINGTSPEGAFIQGKDGSLYGCTLNGGSFVNGSGVNFKVRTDGSGFTVLANYDSRIGRFPALIQGADGKVFACGSGTLGLVAETPALEITRQPRSQTVATGSSVTFSVTATGATSYQWRRNGFDLSAATSPDYTIPTVNAGSGGTYTVVVSSGPSNSVTSANAVLLVAAPNSGRLINLSVRTNAGSGSQTLIAGMVVGGTGTKQVLVRAIGPTLSTFGVGGVLADPRLALFVGGSQTASNSVWGGTPALTSAFSLVGAFPLNAASLDSALLSTLPTGGYSAQVTSVTGGTGVALVEAYDADSASPTARFVNLSARTVAGTGDQTLIAGFVISGNVPRTLLIRGIGPTLASFGVGGVLANPRLELRTKVNNVDTFVASNAGWAGAPSLSAVFAEVGAFALPVTSGDAALFMTLAPGSYTAQVTGAGNTTGVALVELYEVP